MIFYVLLVTAAAGIIGTGLGGCIAALLRRDSPRAISLMLSFAAGVMTGVVCFDLLTEAITTETGGRSSLFLTTIGVLIGYGAVWCLNIWLNKNSQEEEIEKMQDEKAPSSLFLAGIIMAAAIALHNLPEGMVIGTSFAKAAKAGGTIRSGLTMAAVIGLHNIPEGMAVATPLCSGGYRRSKAILLSALTGTPTVLGAALGYFLGTLGPAALTLSLSFASGAMLYVVFGELLPEAARLWNSNLPSLAAVLGILLGLVIVYF